MSRTDTRRLLLKITWLGSSCHTKCNGALESSYMPSRMWNPGYSRFGSWFWLAVPANCECPEFHSVNWNLTRKTGVAWDIKLGANPELEYAIVINTEFSTGEWGVIIT